MAINEIVRYVNNSIIAGNKPEFLRTILEQCKQACLAQEGAPKDVKSYSDQSFTKKLRRFFNKPQLNIQANAAKKSVVWKIESTPFKHATGLAKASTPYGYMEMPEAATRGVL